MKVIPSILLPLTLSTLGVAAPAAGPALTPDALIGTWTMDVAKSHFGTGPAEKSQILVVSKDANGKYSLVADFTDAEGKAFKAQWASSFDWQLEPLNGVPGVDLVQEKLVGPHTWKINFLDKGKVIEYETVHLSADGKVMRAIAVPPKSDKEQWTIHMYFDRQ